MSDAALEKPDQQDEVPRTNIHTIPMEFYGGKNPAPTEVPQSAATPAQQVSAPAQAKLPPRPLAAPPSQNGQIAQPKKSHLVMILVIVLVVLLIAGGAIAWYVLQPKPVVQPEPTPIAVTTSIPEPEVVVPVEVPTSTPSIEVAPTTTTVALVPPHDFKDSADSDNDGLTDIEEGLWNTDPVKTDSDGDSYPDQIELNNLYNPAAIAPQRLVESSLVSTYINSEFGYSIYYPGTWVARPLDELTKKEVLFSAISGEYVEVQALPYPTGKSFPEWFSENFPSEQLTSYQPFVNRFKVSGVMSPDKTVAIITDGTSVYLIHYDGGTRAEINYRMTFRVMVQSFKPVNVATPIDLLPRTLPTPPPAAATTASSSVSLELMSSSTELITSSTAQVIPIKTMSTSTTQATSTPAFASSTAQ